jgi:hypothetical protein
MDAPHGALLNNFNDVPESPRIGEVILFTQGRWRVVDVIRLYRPTGHLSVTAIVKEEFPPD